MTQNASEKNVVPDPAHGRSVLRQVRKVFVGGASALAMSIPLVAEDARAETWQITENYFPGASITTLRKLGRGNGGITHLREPAPANNCPGSAFEVLNPGPDEVRCLGYVTHWWWR